MILVFNYRYFWRISLVVKKGLSFFIRLRSLDRVPEAIDSYRRAVGELQSVMTDATCERKDVCRSIEVLFWGSVVSLNDVK